MRTRSLRRILALGLFVVLAGAPLHAQVPEAADTAASDTIPAEVPPERALADQDVEEELQAVLDRLDGLENVDARVEAGVVTLSGTVLSPRAKSRASELAGQMPGVVYVNDRVEVDTSLGNRLGPTVDRIWERGVDFVVFLPLLIFAVLLLVLFFLLARWIGRLQRPFEVLSGNAFVQNLLRQAVRAVVVLTGLLLAVELLGVTAVVGAVVGTAGIAGLAVGFAFKDIVESYLAGVILSLRRPFEPNDLVCIEEREGKVVRLTGRETILLAPDGNHVRIPNATVLRTVMVNYTRNPLRRFDFEIGIGTDQEIRRAQAAALGVLEAMEGVLERPTPAVRVQEVRDSSVTLLVVGWIDQTRTDILKMRSEAIRLVKAGIEEAGVEMPPPEYTVTMRSTEEEQAEPETERPAAVPGEDPASDQQEVTVDRELDEQVEADRRSSDEPDLLDPE